MMGPADCGLWWHLVARMIVCLSSYLSGSFHSYSAYLCLVLSGDLITGYSWVLELETEVKRRFVVKVSIVSYSIAIHPL